MKAKGLVWMNRTSWVCLGTLVIAGVTSACASKSNAGSGANQSNAAGGTGGAGAGGGGGSTGTPIPEGAAGCVVPGEEQLLHAGQRRRAVGGAAIGACRPPGRMTVRHETARDPRRSRQGRM